jgi:hypothetical protein
MIRPAAGAIGGDDGFWCSRSPGAGILDSMRIGLQTWGSEGDIQPFVALADGLQKAGHEVTLVITSVENKAMPPWPIP